MSKKKETTLNEAIIKIKVELQEKKLKQGIQKQKYKVLKVMLRQREK